MIYASNVYIQDSAWQIPYKTGTAQSSQLWRGIFIHILIFVIEELGQVNGLSGEHV